MFISTRVNIEYEYLFNEKLNEVKNFGFTVFDNTKRLLLDMYCGNVESRLQIHFGSK
jgi:hypothetical protein